MEYIHIWKVKETGELYKIEGRVAQSMDEAIEDYKQEEGCSKLEYEYTLMMGLSRLTYIDIRDEIEERQAYA